MVTLGTLLSSVQSDPLIDVSIQRGHNGPWAVTRNFQRLCPLATQSVFENPPSLDNPDVQDHASCDTLQILPTVHFYPLYWGETEKFFERFNESCSLMYKIKRESFGVHWW